MVTLQVHPLVVTHPLEDSSLAVPSSEATLVAPSSEVSLVVHPLVPLKAAENKAGSLVAFVVIVTFHDS